MALKLLFHPFSSYSQKVLIALYENGTNFSPRMLADQDSFAELAALWSHKKFPVLVDAEKTVLEASIIIEYLQQHHPGAVQLLPADPTQALAVRFMDRFFDNYVMTPMQKAVTDSLRPVESRDHWGVTQARAQLITSYQWLDETLQGRAWAAGEQFSMADCAAAPALFYADWAQPIDARYAQVRAYRARLLARPSVARAVDEARPYRPLFPLGAPDRD